MVAAAKAHRLAQKNAPKPPAAHQADAHALLEMCERKMQNGFPDEALSLASTAVDLFFGDGDKPGESRALSCVAQAMAAGATYQKYDGLAPLTASTDFGESMTQEPSSSLKESLWDSRDPLFAEQGESGMVEEDAGSSAAYTDLTQLPICYGERLILLTCMKNRGRPYDRHRQEALATPRRRGGTAMAWGVKDKDGASAERFDAAKSSSADPSSWFKSAQEPRLNLQQEALLVSRLAAQPRRHKQPARPAGEQLICRSQERAAKLRAAGALDLAAITARLSAPRALRALSPTPGERVVLMWNRSENLRKPDLNRINELAKSSRRGATARAWGVFEDAATTSLPPSPRGDTIEMPPQRSPASAREAPPPRLLPGREAVKDFPRPDVAPNADPALPQLESQSAQETGVDLYHPWRSGVDKYG